MRWLCLGLVAMLTIGCGSDSSGGDTGGTGASGGSSGPGGSGGSGGSTSTSADRVGGFSVPLAVMLFDDNSTGATHRRYQIASDRTAFSYPAGFSADLDGDGYDSVSFLDTRSGVFHLESDGAAARLESVEELLPYAPTSVSPRWLPIAGKVDSDEKDDVGTFDALTGDVKIRKSGDGSDVELSFAGSEGCLPLMGDWDGDGVDSFGRYRVTTGDFELTNDDATFVLEFSIDGVTPSTSVIPVAGDFDGDGSDSVGLYELATRRFHLKSATTSGAADVVVELPPGSIAWLPVVGRWKAAPATAPELGFDWTIGTPAGEGVDAAALDAAFTTADANESIYSVLVARHGKLIGEQYFHGADRSFASNVKSVSKSILSALVAIAVQDGQLAGTATLSDFYPALPPEKKAIALAHLLTMTAGLHWEENGAVFDEWIKSADWAQFPLDQPLDAAPGTTYLYSTGLTHLTSTILTNLTGAPLREYAKAALFDPLGISLVRWDRDPAGVCLGGAEMYFVPRDIARFGELYLENGTLDGKPIIDEAAVASSATQILPPAAVDGTNGYGGWWWTRTFDGHPTFFAWGYGGTFIFVVRDLDLVVVVTSNPDVDGEGTSTNSEAVFDLFEDEILPAVTP